MYDLLEQLLKNCWRSKTYLFRRILQDAMFEDQREGYKTKVKENKSSKVIDSKLVS